MASAKEHRAWAKRTEAFYNSLGGAQAKDAEWAMTALFYTALHEIQAFLVSRASTLSAAGIAVPWGHKERREVLSQRYGKLAPLYDRFLDLDRQGRYDCIVPTEDDLKDAEKLLQRIRTQIKSYR